MVNGEGAQQDPSVLKSVADNIAGKTICAFGEACAWPTQSFLAKFPDEFAAKSTKLVTPRRGFRWRGVAAWPAGAGGRARGGCRRRRRSQTLNTLWDSPYADLRFSNPSDCQACCPWMLKPWPIPVRRFSACRAVLLCNCNSRNCINAGTIMLDKRSKPNLSLRRTDPRPVRESLVLAGALVLGESVLARRHPDGRHGSGDPSANGSVTLIPRVRTSLRPSLICPKRPHSISYTYEQPNDDHRPAARSNGERADRRLSGSNFRKAPA